MQAPWDLWGVVLGGGVFVCHLAWPFLVCLVVEVVGPCVFQALVCFCMHVHSPHWGWVLVDLSGFVLGEAVSVFYFGEPSLVYSWAQKSKMVWACKILTCLHPQMHLLACFVGWGGLC